MWLTHEQRQSATKTAERVAPKIVNLLAEEGVAIFEVSKVFQYAAMMANSPVDSAKEEAGKLALRPVEKTKA